MVSVGRQSISPDSTPLYLMNTSARASRSNLGFSTRLIKTQKSFNAFGELRKVPLVPVVYLFKVLIFLVVLSQLEAMMWSD